MYESLIQKGILRDDPGQREMLEACGPLMRHIEALRRQNNTSELPAVPLRNGTPHTGGKGSNKSSSFMDSLHSVTSACGATIRGFLSRGLEAMRRAVPNYWARDVVVRWPENIGTAKRTGLYLWGDVGVGKTLVMDLFELCETPHFSKRRTHLHFFMCDLIARLQRAESHMRHHSVAPMDIVVNDMLRESPILCLDEFQTLDVAHASLLAAFFSRALPRGLILFTTSNRPPQSLTLISSAFEVCVPLLWRYCDVVQCHSIRDYRENASKSHHERLFLYPNTKDNAKRLIKRVESGVIGDCTWVKDATIWLCGRELIVPFHCGGVALLDFSTICGALGPPDFHCIAKTLHTVVITNIPRINGLDRNAAQQFVIMIDELYQYNVKLLFTSEVRWDNLLDSRASVNATSAELDYYSEGEDERSGNSACSNFRNAEEVLSFSRIASRLKEMGCQHYILRDHRHYVIRDYNLMALLE
ncbi:putative ATPase [Trypanosoma vivax]|nr:putative ATPase [Trypanosoma vivax]